jgi:hypothetical protein
MIWTDRLILYVSKSIAPNKVDINRSVESDAKIKEGSKLRLSLVNPGVPYA